MKSPGGDFLGEQYWSNNLSGPCSWLQKGFQNIIMGSEVILYIADPACWDLL